MTPQDLVLIPGGEFLMGQEDGRDEERPVHRVRVAPFRLCRYQVTNADLNQWGRPPGLPTPEPGRPGGLPHTFVSWFDAVAFCERLSQEWGLPVRLPTEA